MKSRREILKGLGVSGSVVWITPIISSVALSVHGRTSAPTAPPSPPTFALCDPGPGGGIVFQVTNGGLNGLEAALSDHASAPWGCSGTDITGATGTVIGIGAENTAAILAASCNAAGDAANVASGFAGGGFNDWFLPSQDELNEMYTVLRLNNKGVFANEFYWSSSQDGSFGARTQSFVGGSQSTFGKSGALRVRAVRAF